MATTVLPVGRRTWPQRLVLATSVLLVFGLVGSAAGLGYFYWRFGQLPRIAIATLIDQDPGDPFNMLLVGSDSRANIAETEQGSFGDTGDVGGQRADTIMIMRVDPRAERAAILSIPRDLAVPITPGGGVARINTAFNDGPQQLIATIGSALGIEIHHYAQVDFNGFRDIVSTVGGVDVWFPGPARDTVTGLDVPEGGCITLGGDQALAFVRSRQYSVYESGRWRADPRGDLGRIERQQDFIRRMMRKVLEQRNVFRVDQLVDAGIDNVVLDDRLGIDEMLRLGRRFRSLAPETVEMLTVPVTSGRLGAASVLYLVEDEAQTVFDKFRGRPDLPEGVVPSEVHVRVLNGSGSSGQAGQVARALQVVGFNVGAIGDADSFAYPSTLLRYGEGQEDKARLVQAHLLEPAVLEPVTGLTGVDVVLITGDNHAGVRSEPIEVDSDGPATTTTVPSAPASTVPDPAAGDAAEPSGVDPATQC